MKTPPSRWLHQSAALLISAWMLAMLARGCGFIAWSWWILSAPIWIAWAGALLAVTVVLAVTGLLRVFLALVNLVEARRQRRDLERFRRALGNGLFGTLIRHHRLRRGEWCPDVRNSEE